MIENRDRILEGWQGWLASNRRGWRLVVGGICGFLLALLLHFREVSTETLNLHSVAANYVVAQTDFEFLDAETTLFLKQQAAQDIEAIYQLDDKQIREVRLELEEDLIRRKNWRKLAPFSTFEKMYKAADALETILLQERFVNSCTSQKLQDLQLLDSCYFVLSSEESTEVKNLPSSFWETVRGKMKEAGAFYPETIVYVMETFQRHEWHLVEDTALEQALRSQVMRKVPEKWTQVGAGSRIVDRGEPVTERHLAMVQAMGKKVLENRKIWDPLTILASLLLAGIFITLSGLYFRMTQPEFLHSLQKLSLFICIIVFTCLFAKGIEYVLLHGIPQAVDWVRYPIFVPFATILTCILVSPRTAFFVATFLSVIFSVCLVVDPSRFLILNLVTSTVVLLAAQGIRQRKQVFGVCMKSWLSAIIVLYVYTLSENELIQRSFFIDVGVSFLFLELTAVIVVGLLPILETFFGVLTDMTLMEYMNPNVPLLRKFCAEVPGTYQHSLVLGNLAETCAQSIGANGLFCRAATLYHDIGKMKNAQFYTENQQGSVNMHQLLTPLESAQVIISHVLDGEALAKKYHLPQPFIEMIRQHHGTTLVYYFYCKEVERHGGNHEAVDEKLFRYPGPKPQTKEAALIMICDTVEAASRSLDKIDAEKVTHLVDTLVAEKAADGQFDECPLTFKELTQIKETLIQTLVLMHHVRIKYPKKERSG